MRFRFVTGLSVVVLCLAAPVHPPENEWVGIVKTADGTVVVVRGGQTVDAREGMELFRADVVRTGTPGGVGRVFPDDTRLFLGPGSHVAIEKYLFLPVVDDIAEQPEIAEQMLGKLGYRVDSVPSGEAALIFEKEPADLFVPDLVMGQGMDGLDTYRRIIAVHPGQKAILASGYAESDRVLPVQKLGAGAYARKPCTLETTDLAVRREPVRS